jgi:hypothetical protein
MDYLLVLTAWDRFGFCAGVEGTIKNGNDYARFDFVFFQVDGFKTEVFPFRNLAIALAGDSPTSLLTDLFDVDSCVCGSGQ